MPATSQTLNEIISMYLYGQEEAPTDLTRSELIRDTSATSIYQMDVADYMAGPGRFARGSMSSLS
jgi:hypothetical protein